MALKFASTCLADVKKLFVSFVNLLEIFMIKIQIEFNEMLIPSEYQLPGHARLVNLADKGAVAVSRNLIISALGIVSCRSFSVDNFTNLFNCGCRS